MSPRVNLLASLLSLVLIAIPVSAASAASSKQEELAKAGAALYRDKGCSYCHGAGGAGTKKAPPLTDIWKDKKLTTERMTNQILNGGQKMPPFESQSPTTKYRPDRLASREEKAGAATRGLRCHAAGSSSITDP